MTRSPRQRRARFEGVELHWLEQGEGVPLVLIHGLADSHRTWRRVVAHLARHRRVLALDLPGHGLSERPRASYDLAWHTRLVGQWCDYLELDDFDVLGHSYGGGVAQFLMLTHSARMRRLGLVAAGGLGREVAMALRLMALPLGPRVLQPFMRLGTWLGVGVIGNRAFDAEDRAWLARINAQPGSARSFAGTTRGVIGFFGQTMQFLDHAHEIEALPPIALFWGERDPIIPIAHGQAAARQLRHARFVRFPDAGHFPHLSHAERFTERALAFLDDPDIPAAEMVGQSRSALGRIASVAERVTGRSPVWTRHSAA